MIAFLLATALLSGNAATRSQLINRAAIDSLIDQRAEAHCLPDEAVGRLKQGIWHAGQLLRAGHTLEATLLLDDIASELEAADQCGKI